MDGADVSTRLELYRDPWEIKKKLTASDVNGHLSRLLIPQGRVETHMLRPMGPQMSKEMVRRAQSKGGMKVAVWDADTDDKHKLVFRCWASGSYVLNEGWNKLFVKGRGLKVGDEIGMLWDPFSLKFHFKVLRRVARHDR